MDITIVAKNNLINLLQKSCWYISRFSFQFYQMKDVLLYKEPVQKFSKAYNN